MAYAEAQEDSKHKKWFVQSQVSYIKVTELWHSEKVSGQWVNTYPDPSKSYALSLNVLGGYYLVKKRLSLGMGLGYDGYYKPNFSTAPLYGDLRFYFTNEDNIPYIHLALGGNLNLGPGFYRGGYLQLGAGYKIRISDNLLSYIEIAVTRSGISLTGDSWANSDNTYAFQGIGFTFGVFLF